MGWGNGGVRFYGDVCMYGVNRYGRYDIKIEGRSVRDVYLGHGIYLYTTL